jgi:hypothetical protein
MEVPVYASIFLAFRVRLLSSVVAVLINFLNYPAIGRIVNTLSFMTILLARFSSQDHWCAGICSIRRDAKHLI